MATVADQLGVRETTGRSPLETVVEFLATSRALLLLDNLEQVIEVAPEIVSLVEHAPAVQVLVTSRPALRVRASTRCRSGPWQRHPRKPRPRTSATLLRSSCSWTGRRTHYGFGLTDANAEAVAELCRRLDGMPLAIELAVARLRLMSPEQLLERLGTLLDLESGLTGVPARQHTLRATLDWSHDLLSDPEQSLFARQAVFAGGATLEALEAVCDHTEGAVLDTLPGLLDQGMVLTRRRCRRRASLPHARTGRRVRTPAARRACGRRQQPRRHADYYLRLGREAQPCLCGPRQREWAARYDDERPIFVPRSRHVSRPGRRPGHCGWCRTRSSTSTSGTPMEEPHRWIKELGEAPEPDSTRSKRHSRRRAGDGGRNAGDRDVIMLLEEACRVFERAVLPLEAAVARAPPGHPVGRARATRSRRRPLPAVLGGSTPLGHDWRRPRSRSPSGAVCARSTHGSDRSTSDPPWSAHTASTTFPR